MYGMVNKALEGMIREGHGDEAWERIREKAGVDVEVFVSSEGYPDSITYGLVGASSSLLGRPAAELLEAFGVHWVLKTAREGYGPLMQAGGRDLRDFLVNLPNFHTRVMLIFPHLVPPRFDCVDLGDGALELHYRSNRPGLSSFVVGLVKGLGRMFDTPVRVAQTATKDAGADHDVFRVEWGGAPGT